MSSTRRTRPTSSSRSPRSALGGVAIVALTAVGLVIAAPGSGAFATGNPNSAAARVGHSIESGHLIDDVESGRITEADVVQAAKTGIDVHGQHIDNWMDLSPEQAAAGDAQTAELRAAAAADPKMAASLASTKAALHSDASLEAQASTSNGKILESKHWWNHLIHWYTLYINHAWLRGLIGVSAGAAAIAICAFFEITGPICALIGAVFGGGFAEVIKNSASCNGKGLYIKIPDTWKSHCEV
jgi:hypothetical protein